jgi:YHS domain-containing protein
MMGGLSGGVAVVVDPVCGRSVSEHDNGQSVEYAEQRYAFCSTECLQRFQAEPDLFTAKEGRTRPGLSDGKILQAPNTGAGPHGRLENSPSDAGPG